MAEERTEEATPRRREEARRRGEVARSAELTAAAAMLGGLFGVRLAWPGVAAEAQAMSAWFIGGTSLSRLASGDLRSAAELWRAGLGGGVRMIALPLVLACLCAAAAGLAQGGPVASLEVLAPRWSRVSPGEGLRRIFSRRGAVALGRSLVKLAIVAGIGYGYARRHWPGVLALGSRGAMTAVADFGHLAWGLLIRGAGALLALAVADYLYQRHEYAKRLRMTRYEVREEQKRTEGDPLVRSRLRERQRALARHRMLHAVRRATVVVTNPVELAVALRYDLGRMPAPVVVAKGRRLMAERIRAEALRHGVPVVPSPELARALYRFVPVGRQIPRELYQAAAEIIAYVYRMTGRGGGRHG